MNAFQEPAPRYARGVLKRYHEDEAANGPAIGFNEHRNKRVHTLPLRTSPPGARKWAPSAEEVPVEPIAITPPSFFYDMPGDRVQQVQEPGPFHMAAVGGMDVDMAMDDSDSPAAQQLPQNGCSPGHHLAPGPLQPDDIQSTIAGRIPTPLQPSFAAQVRGSSWGLAAGSSALRHPVLEDGDMYSANHDSSVPRSLDHTSLGDWGMVQNRSLPSPISETGGEEAPNPDMTLDQAVYHRHSPDADVSVSVFPPCHDGSESGHSPLRTPTRPAVSPMEMLSSPAHASDVGSVDGDPVVLSSPKKGHTRSRHTIVAWTQQPGMKKSFSIGYRSDCEKCRNRVPGHFNHIIVS